MRVGAIVVLLVALAATTTEAYCSSLSRPHSLPRTSRLNVKRGRGSLGKELGGDQKSGGGFSSSEDSVSSWCQLPAGSKLPAQENEVKLLDTNLPTLTNKATNPTGAVSVLTYKGKNYCFSSVCPSCKIPLAKAKAVDPSPGETAPRLVCEFCKSTYSLSNGAKLGSQKADGLFGGVVQSLLNVNPESAGRLPLFKLGENKNGKLMIDPTVAKK
jgi:nitrite reductase/ring-hydroxylating ferredoxin subunit